MPALKDIKRRIKSVKSTQKITQAMYMIATTKLKKADNRVKASRPFTKQLVNTFKSLLKQPLNVSLMSVQTDHAIENYRVLMADREIKNVGIIVIGSNKGLSGPYVTNVVRKTSERALELKEQGKGVKLFVVGQRAYNGIKRNPNCEVIKLYNKLHEIVTPAEASVIAEEVAEYFVKGEIDKIELLTTEFLSRMNNIPKIWPLLPLEFDQKIVESDQKLNPLMLFEPSPEVILQKILPMYLSNRIYEGMVEAYACELASRMTAMKSATDNAETMIQNLTLKYNKARQSAITQEILEVVSGANALE